MAMRKQRLALPRNPLDCRMTRLCFLEANPRVCCAKLFPTNGVEFVKVGVAADEEIGNKLVDETLERNMFLWIIPIHIPLPRFDDGVDIDLAITEIPAREPWCIDIIVVDAILVDRPSDGNSRCVTWLNMAIRNECTAVSMSVAETIR